MALVLIAACGGTDSPTPTPAPAQEPITETAGAESNAPVESTSVFSETGSVTATTTTTESEIISGTAGITDTAGITESATEETSAAEPQAEAQSVVFDPATTPLSTEPVATGLRLPLFATHAGDGSGRLFIVEKEGTIRILQEGELLATPFLDITDRVGSSASEQGLLGLAFDPNYTESGYFWVNFTDRQGDTVIARFQTGDDPNIVDPATYLPLLSLQQPAPNHNGGMLAFGPDGMLWIGTGDGGAAGDRFGNGQNPATLLGKMLRLDVTSDPEGGYLIPADNPWLEADWNGQAVRDEIWAVGLRNPWRYSFDRVTGDLWIADVGQNIWEEVNFIAADTPGGLNFGWPMMEGLHCFATQNCDESGLTLPVAEYDHSGHCSITGGYVYRGAEYPQLHGVYFYGDYCSGRVWALYRDDSGGWQNPVAFESSLTLSSFAEDEAGELYLVDYSGALHRLVVQ